MSTPEYLDELFELSGYDPNQPRVPEGDPDGGQWTDDAAHIGNWKPKNERFEIRPAFIPKDKGMGTDDALKYVQEWGEYSFVTKEQASLYAASLEKGEGGKWVPEEIGRNRWRAHRVLPVSIPRTGDSRGRLKFDTIKGDGYEISAARYAKGKVLVRVASNGDFKSNAGTIADILAHGHVGWSNRENGYVMSPSAAEKFQKYVIEGWQGYSFSREIRPPENLAA